LLGTKSRKQGDGCLSRELACPHKRRKDVPSQHMRHPQASLHCGTLKQSCRSRVLASASCLWRPFHAHALARSARAVHFTRVDALNALSLRCERRPARREKRPPPTFDRQTKSFAGLRNASHGTRRVALIRSSAPSAQAEVAALCALDSNVQNCRRGGYL